MKTNISSFLPRFTNLKSDKSNRGVGSNLTPTVNLNFRALVVYGHIHECLANIKHTVSIKKATKKISQVDVPKSNERGYCIG